MGGLCVDAPSDFGERAGGFLERGAITAANGYGGPQNGELAGDSAADAAATAGDQRDSVSQKLLFRGLSICFAYSGHENSSSSGPLFLCDTHRIIIVFHRS